MAIELSDLLTIEQINETFVEEDVDSFRMRHLNKHQIQNSYPLMSQK